MGFNVSISGGSAYGTLNLNDHTNYSITSFAPSVADREGGLLGEDDPYGRQLEEVIITVYGATKAAATLNLKKLVAKITQAEIWAAGGVLTSHPAVIFNYTADDSGSDYQAVLYGSPGERRNPLGLTAHL